MRVPLPAAGISANNFDIGKVIEITVIVAAPHGAAITADGEDYNNS
jgi:hypothetical protein